MGNRFAYRAFAKMPALALLLAGAHLGCSGNAQTGSGEPGTESTNTSDQPLLSAEADHETCDGDSDGGATADPPGDPSPSDCGARTTTACRVTNGFRTFRSLQAAINAVGNNAVLNVTGHCAGATVSRRTNLTIQGPFVGCGFNGPGTTTLRATVDGITVRDSTNITVQFLNLVNSGADGVSFDNTINPLVQCACASFNGGDGVRVTGGTRGTNGIFSQIRSQANGQGIESSGTSGVLITSNTVTANRGNGIFVRNATAQNVSGNVVTNNGGAGILFQNVTASIATGNTIRNNGDGLTNLIECALRSRNNIGTNVPRSCM
jgi:parallel beta-helix repeat protein